MRFEVEDAGGGACLGPEIVVVRADDGRHQLRSIPPRLARERRRAACRLVLLALAGLKAVRGDEVFLCRGDLFDETAAAVQERGYLVSRGPVAEVTHRLAEAEHLRRLRNILGFTPRMRDRGYAALNLLLLAEVRRRPELLRHWKANVRMPSKPPLAQQGT